MEVYKMGEFSRAIGQAPRTLREWHEKGLLVPDIITPTGIRIYTQEQVDRYFRGEYGIPRKKLDKE